MRSDKMNARITLSAVLIPLAFLLALIPQNEGERFSAKPEMLVSTLNDETLTLTPDQVARLIATADTTFRLVDLRSNEDYIDLSMPGALNIPYNELIAGDPSIILPTGAKLIFYSNDDLTSNLALAFSRGFRCNNTYVMEGGLNKWFETIMNSTFPEGKISARENALFESRFKARKQFADFNMLPDSLKNAARNAGMTGKVKLDGGCE
jgi:rhodanese-related sulfurtransferase